MNKTEFNRLLKNIDKVTSFLHLEPYDPKRHIQSHYCYSLKVNTACVRETADLWYDWTDYWSIDSFITHFSNQYYRITQVTLRVFDPTEITSPDLLEGPQYCHLIYDIRNRLSESYLYGPMKWPHE